MCGSVFVVKLEVVLVFLVGVDSDLFDIMLGECLGFDYPPLGVCIHAYIHAYIHTCIHTYIHTYIHAYMHTFKYTYMQTYKTRPDNITPRTTTTTTHVHMCMYSLQKKKARTQETNT